MEINLNIVLKRIIFIQNDKIGWLQTDFDETNRIKDELDDIDYKTM